MKSTLLPTIPSVKDDLPSYCRVKTEVLTYEPLQPLPNMAPLLLILSQRKMHPSFFLDLTLLSHLILVYLIQDRVPIKYSCFLII